ncbi:MAG: hypothetical protein HY064_16570 [Bacteroidetes bacterium]|nr:hypothetical protein [Bacteroidota bacterium]
MVEIISDSKEIKLLHRQFHKSLDKYLDKEVPIFVGFPAGSFQDTVQYSTDLNFWLTYNETELNRYWNGFGVGEPIKDKMNSLTGEINFPKTDIDRRVAGAFGREPNGNILVLHRGKIGGGKPGVGKNLFVGNFRGEFVTAMDGDTENQFCLVGQLNSKLFPRQVADFIFEIRRIKDLGNSGQTNGFSELNNFQFSDEHSGQTISEREGQTVIDRTHGIVVNALARELEKRKYKVGNDRNRDLFIHNDNKIQTLFEIKTSSATQNIYSAVGQLIIYSIPIKNEVQLVTVFPDKLSKTVEKRLDNIGIQQLYYDWTDNEPTFHGLDDILK